MNLPVNILKAFGAIFKKIFNKENIGDILITTGLLMIPCITFFINVMIGFYVLSVTLILFGVLYIKGGE